MMESSICKKALVNNVSGNKFECMLNWTKKNRNKSFGKKNSLVYDEKENMDFMSIVNREVKINIKEYFRFNDGNKCEILKKKLTYKKGQKDQFKVKYSSLDVREGVLVRNKVSSRREALEKDENDVIENRLKVCERSKFLVSLEDLMRKNFEVKLMEESMFLNEDLRKKGLSVLVESIEKKVSSVSEDKHDTVENISNFVSLANKNSTVIMCSRNRPLRMKICAYDLNRRTSYLRQFVNNEKILRQEIKIFKIDKKGSVELLVWLMSSQDCVSRVEELVNQRTQRQGVESIKGQVYFCQNSGKPLEQRTPHNVKILLRGFLSQERTRDPEKVYEGKSVFKHQEKGWPNMTGCLNQEVTVQVIKQVGLSSTENNEYGNNFQTGQ